MKNLSWVKMDSNHRSRETADLQSAPFGHSGIHPLACLQLLACKTGDILFNLLTLNGFRIVLFDLLIEFECLSLLVK